MANTLARLSRLEKKAREQRALRGESSSIDWQPFPDSPQLQACDSPADELFFGGAAGGGKTYLLLGLSLIAHRNSIIFRREFPQLREVIDASHKLIGRKGKYNTTEKRWRLKDGRALEFGSCQHEWDREKYQGRPHDFLGFDELPHFTRSQFRYLCGWLLTDDPGQRCRVVCTGNPPTSAEGRWVVEEFAPWLDELHPDPAQPGELRWYVMRGDTIEWLRSPESVEVAHPETGEKKWVTPKSRTFVFSRVEDNPVYMASGYRAQLESLPEPLRSQLLHGDFKAGMKDDEWQVIPTAWVRAAQARWKPEPPAPVPTVLGVDPARGGDDKTVIARRHRNWLAQLAKHPGKGTPDGPTVAGLIFQEVLPHKRQHLRADPEVRIDVIGIGAAVYDQARAKVRARAINFGAGTSKTDRTGKLHFRNVRARAYWSLREALDPDTGDDLALPPDPELLADLCAPRWKYTVSGVQVEAKEEIVKRLGRSPDCGDAVVLACMPGEAPVGKPFALGR